MRRYNNLVTLFTAITAFFFGSFITKILSSVDKSPSHWSEVSDLKSHPNLFLMVLVLSTPRSAEQRNAMRKTWLQTAKKSIQQPYYPEELIYLPTYGPNGLLQLELVDQQANRLKQYMDWQKSLLTRIPLLAHRQIKVKHLFAIGTIKISSSLEAELLREQNQHNDLLLLQRHHDTYGSLTEKLLQALKTLIHNYEFSYIIKVDDDTYVKLDSLLNELVSYDRKLLRKISEYGRNPIPQLYWGYFNGRAKIKGKGHWKETNYYLSKNYLPYALGGGYVLSRKICEYIVNSSQLLTPYVSEDVSIGTWLAPLRHVYRWHDPRFDTAYMPRKCKPYHIVLHKRSLEMMTDIYHGKLCSGTVSSSLPEYYYDWTRTADKCCDSLVV
ncbi:beta-1,3-galactosyltransferase 6 [Drosophila elegans]|uniref:beta-1,3-galactosyltransferase 6 n=1 Tax=Drosophila elegans TaxID=30023 RepID=UPI0007E7E9BE|nr:beta-1,3-galactosyltransferase 6 [Drosophila elegans]